MMNSQEKRKLVDKTYLVQQPTENPSARKILDRNAAVDPLPLVPAM